MHPFTLKEQKLPLAEFQNRKESLLQSQDGYVSLQIHNQII